jgi:hypothetical protein
MRLLDVAGNLDIGGWLRGLIGAGVSGGASAITGGIVVSGMDPSQYNFQAGKFWILTGTLFAVNAIVSIAKFLQTHPLPDEKVVVKTVEVTSQPGTKPTTVTTVAETSVQSTKP